MTAVVRKRVLVRGLVQGVWFRESCRERAQAAGVAGSVRNLPDGSVEACFEGTAGAVDQMVAWCRWGPRRAHIVSVEVHQEAPQGMDGFSVS